MQIEIWKPINNYEDYQISNFGNVRHFDKPLKPCGKTYYCVTLCKNGTTKNYNIHRLVAEAFIPNPDKLECVNHIDENKLNNRVDNLEWMSRGDNTNYGHGHQKMVETKIKKGTMYKKKVIQLLNNKIISIYESAKEASLQTGINHSNIIRVCKGERTNAGGYQWQYAS